ncbi:MAG: haloacid dehalogenase [Chlorobium sp.]|jgi:FMN phosphatase YigB (HAD superfamily)|uniref:haloacid dehalogenase n=1 Tax=Chlorobium sp. TaxID=1095 RepID=UPI001D1D3D34|nr:haloacid dehalogenase [Chlorobium sp.]MBN1279077.1 haloacid dehalogenase [Chlorobiaceae bacterium]MCF8216769.1 haloacid dehalogenase [Chlorobium sp.]MCF8271637.1 haloacid dehalogenase [Chlorobium sp.]MCF8288009.1 haloacid dehalogenase [Chlorobium sp.]MCF8291572.1 haloacid dehalogenase [Chlorobium sp.]
MAIILLDIGNVLVDVDFMIFCRSVSLHGCHGPDELFGRYCVSERKHLFDRGVLSPVDYLATIAADPDVRPMMRRELKTAWQDIFSPKKETPESVREIMRTHTVWIMSDTDPLHFTALLNKVPILRMAERYWLSFEHGYLKREPGAFHEVISCSGNNATQFILIDDREDNCRCAESCGIRAVHFRNWTQALHDL